MISTVLINGRPSDGMIPVTDSSVLRGDGCFEVIRAYEGKPFAVYEHIYRLEKSAAALGIELPGREQLAQWIASSAEELGDCAVRVVVTRGASVPGLDDPSRVIVFSHPWPGGGDSTTLLPVAAPWHAAGIDWELAGAKIISYAPNMAASRRAREDGYGDALLVTPDETILEGPTFSVAWVFEGVIETPSLDLGILGSITREIVLRAARQLGLEVNEGSWPLSRLSDASEVMALSTTREVQAVTAVGEQTFEHGQITKQLRDAFKELIAAM